MGAGAAPSVSIQCFTLTLLPLLICSCFSYTLKVSGAATALTRRHVGCLPRPAQDKKASVNNQWQQSGRTQ